MNRTRYACLVLPVLALAFSAFHARAQDAPPGPVPSGPPTAVEPIPAPTPPAPPAPDPTPEPKAEAPKPKRTRRTKTVAEDPDEDEFAPDELLAATEYIIGKLEAEAEANSKNIRARNALHHLREAVPHLRELAGT